MSNHRDSDGTGKFASKLGSANNLVLRVASAAVLGPLVLVFAYMGGWLFFAFCAAAAAGILWEWTRLVAERADPRILIPGFAALLFALVGPVLMFFVTPVGSLWSRRHEFQADRFASRYASASELAADVQQSKRQRRAHLGTGDIAAGERVGHRDDALTQRLGVAVQIFGHKSANKRYAGLAAMGAFAVFGLLHHVVTGANRVSPEDEENARRLAGGRR